MVEKLNEQGDPDFNVGGVDREMPPELQLEQLLSYIEATYEPSGNYLALLPDRITHAAMLMLGSAVDHTMPGVAYAGGVEVSECELGAVFGLPTNHWCVTCHPGPDQAREFAWRPEVAGAARLSGATVLDVDDPGRFREAVEYARSRGAERVTGWAFGDAAGHLEGADAYILTFPTELPELNGPALVQVATKDEVAPRFDGERYHSTHHISTPAEARRRVRDAAEFLSASSGL